MDQNFAEIDEVRGYGTKPDRERLGRIDAHNQAVGPIETRESRIVERRLDRLLSANSRPMGATTLLGIDGVVADSGKTMAVFGNAVARTRRAWEANGAWHDDGQVIDDCEYWPYAYANVAGGVRTLALVTKIFRFYSPVVPRGNASDVLHYLAEMVEDVGTEVLIIDDAHHLKQTKGDVENLTNFLKALVDALPCSVVFIGNKLSKSALLDNTRPDAQGAVEQLRSRYLPMNYPVYDADSDSDLNWFTQAMRLLEQSLVVPGQNLDGVLSNPDTAAMLITYSAGRMGKAIEWIKDTTYDAVYDRRHIDDALLMSRKPDDLPPNLRTAPATDTTHASRGTPRVPATRRSTTR